MLKKLLQHPLMRGLDVDDPATTEMRKMLIAQKGFLKRIYAEWHELLASSIASGGKKIILELGTGADDFKGYCALHRPRWHVISSDILPIADMDVVLDACSLPFKQECLDAVVMTDVFHHLSDAEKFLEEASMALKPGGVISMIEPWNTPWAKFVYTHFHHEPFRPEVEDIRLKSGSPLSNANGALPWIFFEREKKSFLENFPEFSLSPPNLMMPLSYILSGGVSMRSFLPEFTYKLTRMLENFLPEHICALYAHIIITKIRYV